MEKDALITNIQKFSVRDGPGIRSIVFFKGCPLSCQWCANPENISFNKELMFYDNKCIGCGSCAEVCSEAIIKSETGMLFDWRKCIACGECEKKCGPKARVVKGMMMNCEEIIQNIDSDIAFYKTSGGGVTFSGGEPLLHPDIVKPIAENYRHKGLNSAVETCGCVPWQNIEKVRDWVDLFLYDIKFINEEKHIKYCGGSNKSILSNLLKLCESNSVIVRIPVIPGINDTDEDLELLYDFLKSIRDKIKSINLLPYHNFGISKYDSLGKEYKLSNVKVPDTEYMSLLREKFLSKGLTVQIGG